MQTVSIHTFAAYHIMSVTTWDRVENMKATWFTRVTPLTCPQKVVAIHEGAFGSTHGITVIKFTLASMLDVGAHAFSFSEVASVAFPSAPAVIAIGAFGACPIMSIMA
jgi:hypothetical protein